MENDFNSSNKMHINTLDEAIDKVTGDWISKHQDMKINYQGNQIAFDNYILMVATNTFISNLNKKYDVIKDLSQKKCELHNISIRDEDLIGFLGYSKEDIASPRFKQTIYRLLISKKDIYMKAIVNTQYNIEPFTMKVRNDKSIEFTGKDLNKAVRSIIPKIKQFDPDYFIPTESNVKKVADSYDLNNELQEEKIINNAPQEEKIEIKKPRDRMTYEPPEDYEKYLKEFYDGDNKKEELNEMIQKPRDRMTYEEPKEYENYLKEFYDGGNHK